MILKTAQHKIITLHSDQYDFPTVCMLQSFDSHNVLQDPNDGIFYDVVDSIATTTKIQTLFFNHQRHVAIIGDPICVQILTSCPTCRITKDIETLN